MDALTIPKLKNSNLDGPTRRFHGEISPIPETRPSYYISVDPRIRARLSQCEKPQETAETAHCRYTNPSNFLTIWICNQS